MNTEDLAATVNAARLRIARVKCLIAAGQASYDDLAEAGRAFCAAFDTYHRAKFGKPKRLDYRAVIR